MTRRLLLLLAAVLAVSATALAENPPGKFDWPQWRGPDRNDVSKETGLLKEWPKEGPKLLWTFREAGIGYSSPSIVGDRLYSMGAQDGKELIFAVDLKTQKKVWSTEIGPLYENGWGDGPRGTPTVSDGFVYGIGGQGNLICVKADTGDKVWLKEMGGKELAGKVMSGWGYTESPLVDGNRVVATPGGKKGTVAAFDKKTGELLCRTRDLEDEAAYCSLVPCEIGGVHQYVLMTDKHVAGIAPDGKVLWQADRKGATADIPTPVVSGDLVFVTSGYGIGCNCFKVTGDAKGFTAKQIYANKDMENHHGGVLLVDGYIYGHSGKGGWTCMDLKTGEVVKTAKGRWGENSKFEKGSVTCADGHLYCYGENKGECALVEVTPKGWVETGRFTIPEKTKLARKQGHIWTHPVVSNGKLYLRDQDLIFCYDISAK